MGGGVKSKGPSGADILWPHSSASDPVLQLLWPSPGVLNWTHHFSPRRWPIVHFPTNCWALLSDEFLTIRLFGQCGPSRQREWSAMMAIARRCWAHIRRNDPWASQGRTPLPVTLRCALPEDTSASDPHRYLHISPHAVCRLHLLIPSSFLFIKPWISPSLWMTYFPISNFVQLIFLKSHGLQFYKKRTSTGKKPHLLFLVRLWFDSKVRKPTAEVPLRRPTR